jgi:hypothetical protein
MCPNYPEEECRVLAPLWHTARRTKIRSSAENGFSEVTVLQLFRNYGKFPVHDSLG